MRHINTTYFIWFKKEFILEPAIAWKLVTCQILTLMGQHLSPRYGQVILVSVYPVSTAVNSSQRWCPKCVHYQFSRAPKLASKYEIEHWCPVVRTDGRCTVTWLPNFLGWVEFLSYGASRARGAPLLFCLIFSAAFSRLWWFKIEQAHIDQHFDNEREWKRQFR